MRVFQLDAFKHAKKEFLCLAPVFSRGLHTLLKNAGFFLMIFKFFPLSGEAVGGPCASRAGWPNSGPALPFPSLPAGRPPALQITTQEAPNGPGNGPGAARGAPAAFCCRGRSGRRRREPPLNCFLS